VSNTTTTTPIPYPPCPCWCDTHWTDLDKFDPGSAARVHEHRPALVRLGHVGAFKRSTEVLVVVERWDVGGAVGEPTVRIVDADRIELDLSESLSVDAAEGLARALLDAVAQARLRARTVVCSDCGHDFHPDSSPHLDRCWSCAELADEEAGR
jgi:hypothetical protein